MKRAGQPSSVRCESNSARTVFLSVLYDEQFESLYLAFIAGLCGFGLIPRATIEITGSRRRLERIAGLIQSSSYSFHDLSRVEIDRSPPPTPRFNMPFELGFTVGHAVNRPGTYEWFVFESRSNRLKKSLSDLDGTDPYIHNNEPDGVLRSLANALSRAHDRPKLSELREIYRDLKEAAHKLKQDLRGGSLFEAAPFKDLVILAGMSARQRIASLRDRGSHR
jgi:hypothetical protein